MSSTTPSGAATSLSGPSSSFSSFLEPQTFVPPSSTTSAAESSSSSAGGGSTGGVPSIASSASLYLYTFLATLVLLLSVSAAIVARSFVLRRRHRLMMEEAIRNGTWIPPAPGTGASRPRVDLSKKPVMWEAHLGGGERSAYLHNGRLVQPDVSSTNSIDAEKDWESIKPIFAAYLSKGPTPAPIPVPSASDLRPLDAPATMETRLNAFVDWAARIVSPTPSTPLSPLPAPLVNGNMQDASTPTEDELGPPRVRVAVLIAMPSPHHASPSASQDRLHTDEELPHLEMGVATLPVLSHEGDEAQTHKGKNSIGSRDSASLE